MGDFHAWRTRCGRLIPPNVNFDDEDTEVSFKKHPQHQLWKMYPERRIEDDLIGPCMSCTLSARVVDTRLPSDRCESTVAATMAAFAARRTSLCVPREIIMSRDAYEQQPAAGAICSMSSTQYNSYMRTFVSRQVCKNRFTGCYARRVPAGTSDDARPLYEGLVPSTRSSQNVCVWNQIVACVHKLHHQESKVEAAEPRSPPRPGHTTDLNMPGSRDGKANLGACAAAGAYQRQWSAHHILLAERATQRRRTNRMQHRIISSMQRHANTCETDSHILVAAENKTAPIRDHIQSRAAAVSQPTRARS